MNVPREHTKIAGVSASFHSPCQQIMARRCRWGHFGGSGGLLQPQERVYPLQAGSSLWMGWKPIVFPSGITRDCCVVLGCFSPNYPACPLIALIALGAAHASSEKKQKWSPQTACTGLMLYIGQQCKFADSSLIAIRSFLLHIQQFWQLLMLLTLHQV